MCVFVRVLHFDCVASQLATQTFCAGDMLVLEHTHTHTHFQALHRTAAAAALCRRVAVAVAVAAQNK